MLIYIDLNCIHIFFFNVFHLQLQVSLILIIYIIENQML